MNVDFQNGPCWPCLSLSPAFHDLDPTEKGIVSYYLGMMVAKLCAHELLDTPWLVHLNWMEREGRLSNLPKGRSRADLLGFSRKTEKWSLFEAKGRSGSFSQQILNDAKTQAKMNVTIDGTQKDLGIACALFTENYFDFHWQDPISDEGEPVKLQTTRDTWKAYYSNAFALYKIQKEFSEDTIRLFGFKIDIHPSTVEFIELLDIKENEFWRDYLGVMRTEISKSESSEEVGEFVGLDGITVRLTKEMLE